MNLGLKGKRAFVTASGRGLGRSIATCLAREGASVGVCARTQSDIDELLAEIGGTANGHFGMSVDLVSDAGPAALIGKLKESEFWPLDIVVHNLGGTLDINDPYCGIDDWRRVWRANLEVALELNHEILPEMRKRRWGRSIFISSISAMENHGPVPYCSIKAALTAYARSMGRVVARDGIVLTAILPGAVYTAGGYWDEASRDRPDHVEKYLSERMAIGRFGKPEEIGDFVAFLASEQASFCIGSVVPIDGGQGRGFFGQ